MEIQQQQLEIKRLKEEMASRDEAAKRCMQQRINEGGGGGGGGRCNCSCFEIDQEMDAILLIIGIVYRVCRIVIKSVQQCTYFLFSVNLLLVSVNYGQRIMKVCS